MAWYSITVNDNGGSGSAPTVYYVQTSGASIGYYKTNKSTSASNVFSGLTTTPTRKYYSYAGHWSAKTGGRQYISSTGSGGGTNYTYGETSNITIYAHWTRLSYDLVLDRSEKPGQTSTTIYGKATDGGWFRDWQCTNPITQFSITAASMIWDGHVFDGMFAQPGGQGTRYAERDGSFTGDFALLVLTANKTIYAHWHTRHVVAFDTAGGSAVSDVYWVPERGELYSDAECLDAVDRITPPTKPGAVFAGFYATSDFSGDPVVDEDGVFAAGFAPTEDVTLYAKFRTVVYVHLDNGDGDSGTSAIYYDSDDAAWHDADTHDVLESVDVPHLECFGFLGYYTTGGVQYIAADGSLLPALTGNIPTGDVTVSARWTRVSYRMLFDLAGGAVDVMTVYCDGTHAVFYLDDLLQGEPTITVPVPTRAGHDFGGYWLGGSQVVDAGGVIVTPAFDQDVEATAQWSVRTYTLTFDYAGGSGSASSKTVTWGQPVGTLPTPVPPLQDFQFEAWTVGGRRITADTVWDIDADATAVARWRTGFGEVEDYFGLESDALRPISSESGDDRPRVVTANATVRNGTQTGAGRYSQGVDASGCIWRNPTVTYAIVRDTTVSLRLGKAYAATFAGTGSARRMTVSGWMVTSAKLSTGVGRFPTLVVSATANEGADAINLFDVSVSVRARARAQNLLDAVVGGGQLQSSEVTASCTPVVCAENMVPCASDVVLGQLTVSATTAAPNGEAAPSAGGGFASVGEPKSNGDKAYPAWKITCRKEIV